MFQKTMFMIYLLSFVETPRKFIIAELSIRKLGSSSVLIILSSANIISTDEDPSLRIESSAIINLRGVSTKLNKYIVFTMQTYKKLNVHDNYKGRSSYWFSFLSSLTSQSLETFLTLNNLN